MLHYCRFSARQTGLWIIAFMLIIEKILFWGMLVPWHPTAALQSRLFLLFVKLRIHRCTHLFTIYFLFFFNCLLSAWLAARLWNMNECGIMISRAELYFLLSLWICRLDELLCEDGVSSCTTLFACHKALLSCSLCSPFMGTAVYYLTISHLKPTNPGWDCVFFFLFNCIIWVAHTAGYT